MRLITGSAIEHSALRILRDGLRRFGLFFQLRKTSHPQCRFLIQLLKRTLAQSSGESLSTGGAGVSE
jgi:hypothetical protein